MKLRNKKTGEIVSLQGELTYDDKVRLLTHYNSLAKLNEEWEDYEEPFSTSFYTIVDGKIKHCIFYRERIAGCPSDTWAYLKDDGKERIKQLKEIGLYFETKEETEKAVEKLKAWKRLKDKGFKFISWSDNDVDFKLENGYEGYIYDLDLLFGGEE